MLDEIPRISVSQLACTRHRLGGVGGTMMHAFSRRYCVEEGSAVQHRLETW